MEKNCITVIVPFYNAKEYIEKCLINFSKQSCQEFELILIDDGSNDGSKELINKLKDRYRFNCIHQKNKGVSEARNTGIENARGEFILFVDVDDSINEKFIEKLVFSAQEEGTLVCCSYTIDYPKENKYIKKIISSSIEEKGKDYAILQMDRAGVLNVVWNKIFRKSILEKENIRFNKDLKSGEDLDFVYKYCRFVDRIVIIEEALYNYIRIENKSTLSKHIINLEYSLSYVERSRQSYYFSTSLNSNEYLDFLNDCYVRSKMILVNNSYKNGASKKSRKMIMDSILHDTKLKRYVKMIEINSIDKRIFCYLVRSKSIYLCLFSYNVLFFLRYKLNNVYKFLYPFVFKHKFNKRESS